MLRIVSPFYQYVMQSLISISQHTLTRSEQRGSEIIMGGFCCL